MITISSTLIESFDPDNEGPRWEKWIARLNQFFKANGMNVDDLDEKMLNILFLLGVERVYEIHSTLDDAVLVIQRLQKIMIKRVLDFQLISIQKVIR